MGADRLYTDHRAVAVGHHGDRAFWLSKGPGPTRGTKREPEGGGFQASGTRRLLV